MTPSYRPKPARSTCDSTTKPAAADPPDEQALDPRLRPAREAVDEGGAAFGLRRQDLVDLTSGEHAFVQRRVDRRARVLGVHAAERGGERRLRRDDPVEGGAGRGLERPMHPRRGIRCETHDAPTRPRRRHRRMPHAGVRDEGDRVAGASRDAVRGTCRWSASSTPDQTPKRRKAEEHPMRPRSRSREVGPDPRAAMRSNRVAAGARAPRERDAQGGRREAPGVQRRNPRDVAEAGELAEEVGHGDEHGLRGAPASEAGADRVRRTAERGVAVEEEWRGRASVDAGTSGAAAACRGDDTPGRGEEFLHSEWVRVGRWR